MDNPQTPGIDAKGKENSENNKNNEIGKKEQKTNSENNKNNENPLKVEMKQNILDEALIETNNQKMVQSIIQKWLLLQKTIKEEITLEEIIFRHQENEFNQLQDYFKKYYSIKLESRKILAEINVLDKDKPEKIKELVIEKDLKDVILDVYEPIKDLLFTFRNNYDYIITLVSLISDNDKEENISSLIELFCNQFYENILIPNPEQEELLLLIYRLLEIEITPMDSASTDYFLNDDSFLGKFISSFMKRQEVKIFFSSLLNPLILDIENNSTNNYLGMSLISIKNYIYFINQYDDNISRACEISIEEIEKVLFENIQKSSIIFKQFKKKNQKEVEYINIEVEEEEDEEEERDDEKEEEIVENWNKNINYNEDINKQCELNCNYENMIDLDFLEKQINSDEDEDIKKLYLYEIEQITYEEDMFSNKSLIEILKSNEFKKNRKYIINKYKSNFIFIKNKIDFLIQSLIDKIESIPYTVRCICKLIYLLFKKKFSSLNKYLKNSFIGKFIFDKCIFPILSLENKNILEPRILSTDTKKCLSYIISVLSYTNRCLLFNKNVDPEKTIFNHYILELIPILNIFYEKLIDIELPHALNYLVNKTQINPETSFDNISHKENPILNNINKGNKNLEKISVYNYFHEHNDELLHLQCICFSLEDILYILTLIGRNIQAFSGLQDFTPFEKTYKYILDQEYKLDRENSQDKDKTKFFLIFKTEKNAVFEKLINQNKTIISSFTSENQDTDLICKRFKFCIKTVLKGLNLLNNKDYSYLNMAFSTSKFFSALKYTLDDFGELSEANNKIPLK